MEIDRYHHQYVSHLDMICLLVKEVKNGVYRLRIGYIYGAIQP